jgi:hypothetical protein
MNLLFYPITVNECVTRPCRSTYLLAQITTRRQSPPSERRRQDTTDCPPPTSMSHSTCSAAAAAAVDLSVRPRPFHRPTTVTDSSQSSSITDYYKPTTSKVRKRMYAHLTRVRQAWARSVRNYRTNQEFSHALLALHCGYPELMTKSSFIQHLSSLSDLFRFNAFQQPEFIRLAPQEQERLLSKNGPLFSQFILSGYLCGSTGREQMNRLLVGKLSKRVIRNPAQLLRVKPCMLNSVIKVFPSDSDLDHYESQAGQLDDLHDQDHRTSIISLLCLYHGCSVGHFEDVLTLAEWSHEVLDAGAEREELLCLMKALEECQDVFEKVSACQGRDSPILLNS